MKSVLRSTALLAAIGAALAACGQQGPLYLRDEEPAAVVTPVEPAPAAAPEASPAPATPAATPPGTPDETGPRTGRDPARTPR